MNVIWTEGEKDYVAENAATMTDGEIAVALTEAAGGRHAFTLGAVRRQRQKMGIVKLCGRGVCGVASRPD